jgi:hypothetical protein
VLSGEVRRCGVLADGRGAYRELAPTRQRQARELGGRRLVALADRQSPATVEPGLAVAVRRARLVRPGLLADPAVDPLAEQVRVAEVAGILLDHVQYHLAQRDGRAVLHRAADGEVG